MLVARRRAEDALSGVQRGIELAKKAPNSSMAGYDLATLKRDLLTTLGRGREAVDAAWAEYRQHPSKYTYDDLMKWLRTQIAGLQERQSKLMADLGR
jgi:hypothetical protein